MVIISQRRGNLFDACESKHVYYTYTHKMWLLTVHFTAPFAQTTWFDAGQYSYWNFNPYGYESVTTTVYLTFVSQTNFLLSAPSPVISPLCVIHSLQWNPLQKSQNWWLRGVSWYYLKCIKLFCDFLKARRKKVPEQLKCDNYKWFVYDGRVWIGLLVSPEWDQPISDIRFSKLNFWAAFHIS